MRKITAKYPGRCVKCGKAIAVNDWIFWTKEEGKRGQAWHEACDANAQPDATPEPEPQADGAPEAPEAHADATPETPKAPEPPKPTAIKVRRVPLPRRGGMEHPLFPTLRALAESGAHVYVYGAPGGGKSHAAEALATLLERPYRYVSLSPQSMPSLLFGYMDAHGKYVRTGFRDVAEYGGVICVDEIDNANANLVASLNSALANRLVEFPDMQVPMHAECIVVATGNTCGNGPTLAFPERRPLDRATRDRFVFLEWTYAKRHERAVARGIAVERGLPEPLADAWTDWVHEVRAYCARAFPALTCSPRSIYSGLPLLARLAPSKVADLTLFQGAADETTRRKIMEACPLPAIEWDDAGDAPETAEVQDDA